MSEIICKKCSAKLEDRFVFCPYCGSEIRQTQQRAEPAETEAVFPSPEGQAESAYEYTPSEGPYFSNAALFRARMTPVSEIEGSDGYMTPDEREAEEQKRRRKKGAVCLVFAILSVLFSWISFLSTTCLTIDPGGALKYVFVLLSLLSVASVVFAIVAIVKTTGFTREFGFLTGTAKVGRILGIIGLVSGVMAVLSMLRSVIVMLFVIGF